jgi:hypothetical protein
MQCDVGLKSPMYIKFGTEEVGNTQHMCFFFKRETCGRAIAQLVSHRGGPDSIPDPVTWDLWAKWHLGQNFSKYLNFPYQFLFHELFHIH